MALPGTGVSGRVDRDILKVVLGVGLFMVGLSFLRSPEAKYVGRMDGAIEQVAQRVTGSAKPEC